MQTLTTKGTSSAASILPSVDLPSPASRFEFFKKLQRMVFRGNLVCDPKQRPLKPRWQGQVVRICVPIDTSGCNPKDEG
jgi:hypothetical protein